MGINLTSLLNSNENNEKKFIAYAFIYPDKLKSVNIEGFQNNDCLLLYGAIDQAISTNLAIEKDILFDIVREYDRNFQLSIIESLQQNYKDFTNILEVIESINNRAIAVDLATDIDLLTQATLDFGKLDKEKIQDIANKINSKAFQLNNTNVLLDGEGIIAQYEDTMEKRIKGESKRTLAYASLDKDIERPAEPGEMTGIGADKGTGKSIIAKNIENKLINKGTCVLSVNLEMTLPSTVDRLLAIRESLVLKELISPEDFPGSKRKIDIGMTKFRKLKNYLYYPEASLTLNGLDSLIYESKQIFKNNKVLPDDEYMVVVVDLLTMIKEFSGKSGSELDFVINNLHEIVKKHNIHLIAILQTNENKFRSSQQIKNPDSLDFIKLGLEDIKNGAAFAERCRIMITVNRPLLLKRRFFPEREEEWDLEDDIFWLHIVKQNDGKLFRAPFVLTNSLRLYEYVY